MTPLYEKQSPMIRRALWQTSSIKGCLMSGDIDNAISLCKSMTLYLSNIQNVMRILPYPEYENNLIVLWPSKADAPSSSPTT